MTKHDINLAAITLARMGLTLADTQARNERGRLLRSIRRGEGETAQPGDKDGLCRARQAVWSLLRKRPDPPSYPAIAQFWGCSHSSVCGAVAAELIASARARLDEAEKANERERKAEQGRRGAKCG